MKHKLSPDGRTLTITIDDDERTQLRELADQENGDFASDKAIADLLMVGVNIESPKTVDLWQGSAKHHYAGTSEGGDGMGPAPFVGSCFAATGKDVALVTVIDARPVGRDPHVLSVQALDIHGVDGHLLQIQTVNGADIIQINFHFIFKEYKNLDQSIDH